MVYASIGKQMYKEGWISRKLYKKGGIPIDLYYLWINNVQISEYDVNYIKDSFYDNATIESQIDAYCLLHNTSIAFKDDDVKEHCLEQIKILQAILLIKKEQAN